MGSFHISLLLTLTILVTGTSLAAVSLYLARYLRSRQSFFSPLSISRLPHTFSRNRIGAR